MSAVIGLYSKAKVLVYLAIASAAALAIGAASGFYAGREWQLGREARADVKGLQTALDGYRRELFISAQDFRTAADRMSTISADYQENRDAQNVFFGTLQSKWSDYFRARPDLARCMLDADGLRQWNSANRGSADAAAAGDPGGPQAAVRADAGRPEWPAPDTD